MGLLKSLKKLKEKNSILMENELNNKDNLSQTQNLCIKSTNENVDSRNGELEEKKIVIKDPLIEEAGQLVIYKTKAAIGMLQRQFKIGFNRAAKIMDELYELGVIGEEVGTRPRAVLMTEDEFDKLMRNAVLKDDGDVYQAEQPSSIDRMLFYNNKFDYMEGHDFEKYCAFLLSNNGFDNIVVTKGSGDQGIDVIALKDGVKYGIQCKCYNSDIGNRAVQEAFAGAKFYDCHVPVVMTNRFFTSSAKELAQKIGVLLWDRNTIIKLSDDRNVKNQSECLKERTYKLEGDGIIKFSLKKDFEIGIIVIISDAERASLILNTYTDLFILKPEKMSFLISCNGITAAWIRETNQEAYVKKDESGHWVVGDPDWLVTDESHLTMNENEINDFKSNITQMAMEFMESKIEEFEY